MKKLFFTLITALFSFSVLATTPPDEGMWLPMFIKDYNYEEMQRLGLKMTPEQMYDINNSSLKDAIIQLGNFCTGEIVSKDGLMFTNHHCGYGAIADHSTEEHDYLKYGFWAKNRGEELPNPGLTATFLVRMDDVTKLVLDGVTSQTTEKERVSITEKAIKKLQDENSENGKYTVVIKPFYEGNEYYMFVYSIYKDVRLVGAPPSGIGKFGGETDNWMWPRHTGDFSVFRIYSAPDGSPAEYSPNNIPLQPKHHLPVNLKGIEIGDFSMTWGFPGRTERFMTSFEVNNEINIENPALIEVCDALLPVIQEEMLNSDKIRIGYASHFAGMSNAWKNKQGATASLKQLKVPERKAAQEKAVEEWIKKDSERVKKYAAALSDIEKACATLDPIAMRAYTYSNYSLYITKTLMAPYRLRNTKPGKDEKNFSEEKIKSLLEVYTSLMEGTDPATEGKVIAASLKLWEKLPQENRPEIYEYINKNFKGDYAKFGEAVATKSIFGNVQNYTKFLNAPSLKKYEADPLVRYFEAVFKVLLQGQASYAGYSNQLNISRRQYIAALKEMQGANPMYPDANSTMRMSYGQVLDYYPVDGVHYLHYTTSQGILDKDNPGDPEFEVPTKLKDLILAKDFGRYCSNDTLNVCFLSNNDITGGNSGSPVINGNGEIIGIAFDGNWEALSSDIVFNPELQRCINVDIRYVLFIIDKFGGAGYLLDEMTIIE